MARTVCYWVKYRFDRHASLDDLGIPRYPPDARALYEWLLTGPHLNLYGAIPGLFQAGKGLLSDTLGWPSEAFAAALELLQELGVVQADWKCRLVCLPWELGQHLPANLNMIKAWVRYWQDLPECQLRRQAADEILCHLRREADDPAADEKSRGNRSEQAAEWVRGTVPQTVSQTVSRSGGPRLWQHTPPAEPADPAIADHPDPPPSLSPGQRNRSGNGFGNGFANGLPNRSTPDLRSPDEDEDQRDEDPPSGGLGGLPRRRSGQPGQPAFAYVALHAFWRASHNAAGATLLIDWIPSVPPVCVGLPGALDPGLSKMWFETVKRYMADHQLAEQQLLERLEKAGRYLAEGQFRWAGHAGGVALNALIAYRSPQFGRLIAEALGWRADRPATTRAGSGSAPTRILNIRQEGRGDGR